MYLKKQTKKLLLIPQKIKTEATEKHDPKHQGCTKQIRNDFRIPGLLTPSASHDHVITFATKVFISELC